MKIHNNLIYLNYLLFIFYGHFIFEILLTNYKKKQIDINRRIEEKDLQKS